MHLQNFPFPPCHDLTVSTPCRILLSPIILPKKLACHPLKSIFYKKIYPILSGGRHYRIQLQNIPNAKILTKCHNTILCKNTLQIYNDIVTGYCKNIELNFHKYYLNSSICVWRNLVVQMVGRSHQWSLHSKMFLQLKTIPQ